MKKIAPVCLLFVLLFMAGTAGCIGLDDIKARIDFYLNPSQATIDAINDGIAMIDRQPGQWESVGENLIGKMGYTTNSVIRNAAAEIKGTSGELAGMVGGTVQCRTDSVAIRFKHYLEKIRHNLDSSYPAPPVDPPAVCSFTVDRSGDPLLYIDETSSFVHYYGYDFAGYHLQKKFAAEIVYGDPNQTLVKTIDVSPNYATNYELIADIQSLDAKFWSSLDKNRGPRLRLKWGDGVVSSDNTSDPQKSEIPLKVTAKVLPPVASFTASPTSGDAPLLVTFTDTSSNAVTRKWDFGDPSYPNVDNTAPQAQWKYLNPGLYNVTVIASNGAQDTVTAPITQIRVGAKQKKMTVQQIPGSQTSCKQVCNARGLLPLSSGRWQHMVMNGFGKFELKDGGEFYYCSYPAANTGVRAGYNLGAVCTIGWAGGRAQSPDFNCVCLPNGLENAHQLSAIGNCDKACQSRGPGWSPIASGVYDGKPMYYCAFNKNDEGLRPGYNILDTCTVEYNGKENGENTFYCPCVKEM